MVPDVESVVHVYAPHGPDLDVPASYHVGHEAHFGQVARQFLGYVEQGSLPAWEVPNTLAKYSTTTRALAMATMTTTADPGGATSGLTAASLWIRC